MFKYLNEQIKMFNAKLKENSFNNEFKGDLDHQLSKLAYCGLHKNIKNEINEIKLKNNFTFTKGYNYHNSDCFRSKNDSFQNNAIVNGTNVYTRQGEKLEMNSKRKYVFNEHFNHKPFFIEFDIDNKDNKQNKIKVNIQVNEIGVKHIYDPVHHNSFDGVIYEKKIKINDKPISIKELQEITPNVYKTIHENIDGILNIVRLNILFEENNVKAKILNDKKEREDEVKEFMEL